MIDSIYRKDKKYYPQTCLEEYNYIVKEKIRLSLIFIDDPDKEDPDDSDEENSDDENSNEENSNEEN